MNNTSSTVSKLIPIAIDDRKATIAIAIGDLIWNGDRDRDRDLKFDQDRDQDRNSNFRDRGHAPSVIQEFSQFLRKNASKILLQYQETFG